LTIFSAIADPNLPASQTMQISGRQSDTPWGVSYPPWAAAVKFAHFIVAAYSGRVTSTVPQIYAPRYTNNKLDTGSRAGFAVLALGCIAVLMVAAMLPPDQHGVSTHTRLGLQPCEFLQRTGLPCPSCGMTTSFSLFAHGRLLSSLYVQPMGFALAIGAAGGFWIGLYIALTGRPALRLMRLIPARYYALPLMLFAIAAWGWKIFIHLKGIDGW
jgi:hypothetical protein